MTSTNTDRAPLALVNNPDLQDRFDRLPFHAVELIWAGLEAHLFTVDELPANDRALDEIAYRASVGKFLREKGADEVFRATARAGVYVVHCPFWCHTIHPQVIGEDDSVYHRPFPEKVIVSFNNGGEHHGTVATLSISAWESTTRIEGPMVHLELPRVDGDMNAADLRALAGAMTQMAETVERFTELAEVAAR